MKKFLSLVFLVCFLCSCNGAKEIEPHLTGISFEAEIVYYNEKYSLDGEISRSGDFTFKMKEPKELSDLVINYSNGQTRVDYKGLVYTPLEGTMPFAKVLDEFCGPITRVIECGEMADSDGVLKGDNFVLTLAPTGLPLKLELPDERFIIKFFNVSICED